MTDRGSSEMAAVEMRDRVVVQETVQMQTVVALVAGGLGVTFVLCAVSRLRGATSSTGNCCRPHRSPTSRRRQPVVRNLLTVVKEPRRLDPGSVRLGPTGVLGAESPG